MAVIGGCIWLANWQVERAEFKRDLIERHQAMDSIDLNTGTTPQSLPARISVRGRWDGSRQVLIDNQVFNGRTGVFVLTPLVLEDRRMLLVNRGWAPWPSRQEALPDPPVTTEVGTISGVLNEPPRVGRILQGRAALAGDGWPLLATWFEHAELSDRFGPELAESVIQLDPDHAEHLTGRPWPIISFGPKRHLGYALTWATMAVTVLIIWLTLSVRASRRRHADHSGKSNPASRT